MAISSKLSELVNELKQANCKLVAVSKTKSVEQILDIYKQGIRCFGENKAQELAAKQAVLPDDIEWHFIGHLQRNKVKYIAPFVSLIHSVDSLRLLQEINKHGEKHNRKIACLLQVHVAEEETKFGLSQDELFALIENKDLESMNNIEIQGLMAMATFSEDKEKVRKEFRNAKSLFESLKERVLPDNMSMAQLSMGMSADYKLAIEEGSTMVRIGSTIFGQRGI